MTVASQRRVRSTADIVVTVLLVLVHALLCPVIGFLSIISVFATDACVGAQCDYVLVNVAYWIGLIAPSALLVAVLVVLVILFRRRRLGWWVALLGIVSSVLVFVAVVLTVDAAVPNPGESLF